MRPLLAPLALAALVLPIQAQDHSATRFAVFIPEQVISTSARAKKVFAEMEALGASLQGKLSTRVEELRKVEQQIKSPGLSEEGRAKLQRELQDGEIALKRLQEDSQVDFNKVREKALGQFQQEIGPILQAVAKEQKLQVVLQYQAGMLIPVDEAWMVAFSNEVAKRYDAKFEGGKSEEKPAEKPAAKPAKPAVKK